MYAKNHLDLWTDRRRDCFRNDSWKPTLMESGDIEFRQWGDRGLYHHRNFIIDGLFGIKSCRDYHFKGSISFWQGIKIGLLITLIASIIYALTWEFSLRSLAPDFSDKMWQHYIDNAKNESQNEAELKAAVQQVETWKEWYKNPVLRFGLMLMEIVPVGIVITIISAAILRKKQVLPA